MSLRPTWTQRLFDTKMREREEKFFNYKKEWLRDRPRIDLTTDDIVGWTWTCIPAQTDLAEWSIGDQDAIREALAKVADSLDKG